MANNIQSQTYGLDCEIKQFQKELYESLVDQYGVVDGYPRVYKNPRGEEVVPEVWDEASGEYKEMLFSDSSALTFFFIDGDNHTTDNTDFLRCDLKVVVAANLDNIDSVVRADAEIQRQVFHSIKSDVNVPFEIEGIEKGIETVFDGLKIDQINLQDMQPYHLFAVKGKIGYYLTKTCQ